MKFEDIIYFFDNIVLIYVAIMFFVFFIFVISSALSFDKHIKFRGFINNFNLDYNADYIPVSLLVPAYNEEVTICKTIESLLATDYKQYEIIIINDGSTDSTFEVIEQKYKLKHIYKPMKRSIETKDILSVYKGEVNNVFITVINKVNGGKADALNVGINYAKYPIFITIDADSILEKGAVRNIIVPFMKNKKTIAVGGNIRIANAFTIENGVVTKIDTPKGLIIPFQMIEYFRAFLTNRMTWNILNMNLIISGAFGAFRKRDVINVGGYKNNTVGEDMELVMRLHKKFIENKEEYYISYAPDANCYTQAPETLKGLKVQRRRWQRGLIHSMSLHKNLFLNRRWLLAKLYFILFEMITPIIEVVGMIIILLSFIFKIINLKFVLCYYGFIIIYSLAISISAILLQVYAFKEDINKKVIARLMIISIFEGIGYRQFLTLYRASAFIGYKKNKYKWGTIKREKQN